MKKVLLLAVCLVLVLSLAGVGLVSGATAKKPLVLTMYCADINPNYNNFEDPVAKEITRITGVKLKMDYPIGGDAKQKETLMLASGDYPDLLFLKGAQQFVEAKALVNLAPLIEKYGPNIKKLYGDYLKRMRYSPKDPSIYYLGCFGVDDETWEPSGFELQHIAVKEAGFPRLKTVKDYEGVIQKYVDKHPTVDGQPTIGLSLLADDWRILISVTNPAVFATGGPDDGEWYVDPKTFKAVLHHTRPIEKEYFRWLNHMNDIGLLDPESFVQKYDQYLAKISSGRVVGLIDQRWEYAGSAEQALKQAGKFEYTYGNYPITLNENIVSHEIQSSGYSASWGISISKKCKNPVAAIKFLDWMASDEGMILRMWGIKGKNYVIINGKRVIPKEEWDNRNNDPNYQRNTGVGQWIHPFPQRGLGSKDPTGQYYNPTTPQTIIDRYSDIEKEVLAAYKAKMWLDIWPDWKKLGVKPWGALWQLNTPQDASWTVPWQKCQDIIRKRIPEAILAKPDKFDAIYDAFLKELEDAGVHSLEATMNKLIKERLDFWK
ncbi:MAG: ABC transporter substrate-binding protein [Firmicutes bacterium]|nr:ABC transporter substrate-binding protein [Bacillota bacterium]